MNANHLAGQSGHQTHPAGIALDEARYPLMRRLSITSLLATIVTAILLISLYRQDQLAEHEAIAAEENEKTATHLIQLMSRQIGAYLAATAGLDIQALRTNPGIGPFNTTLNTVREHRILKLKLYDLSGMVVFSTVTQDIGGGSRNREMPGKALASGTQHKLEFREAFRTTAGEIRDRQILATYVPLTEAEKRIGVLEIYSDITPAFDRIHSRIIQIALIIFGAFMVMYTALFLSALRADHALTRWQRTLTNSNRKLAENEARLWATVNSALDGVVSIDEESRVIAFNPAAETMFGWQKDEVIGRPMIELLIPERFREQHRNGLTHYLQTGESRILNRRIEVTALRRDGTEFPAELTVTPIREDNHMIFTAFIRDITKRKQIQHELENREARYRRLIENSPNVIYTFSNKKGGIYYSPRAQDVLGYSLEHLYAHPMLWNESIHPDDQELASNALHEFESGKAYDIEYRIRDAQGNWRWLWDRSIGSQINGDEILIEGLATDISEIKLAENELRIAATAFESQEGMFITGADGVIQRVNNAFVETTGYSAEEAVGKTPAILKSGRHDAAFYQEIREALDRDGHWQGEIWNRRKNGEIYPEWETISVVKGADGQITHYVSTFTDISLRKKTEEQIRTLAFYDPLTQLPNRRLLLDRLHQALASSVRNERQGALLFIDLDNFKSINDTQGHAVGDLLLVEAARRLQGCIREGDTTARLSGDEFVVLLEDLDANEQAAASQAETVGEKILATIGKPYFINGHEHHSTASIGITLFRGPVKTMDEMLKRADVALYQAKADGRNILRFFDPAMQAAVTARVALESDLRRAILEQEQLQLYYQAQVDSSGRLTGAEALVRWRHPERGMVSPGEFIPLAEESGLILPLGHWVMTTACQQLAAWAERPETAHLTLAVNVSAKQFHLPTFVEEVATLVDYFGIDPTRLKLEITESLMVENVDDIIAKMTALKTRGINFSMDDFGTGYSSLSYLKRLPLYQLKIDQSFVRDVLTDPNDAAIARIIVSLAQSMNLMVIAEGVETEAQREFLELNGCHAFQGYLFSKPVPSEEFEQLLPQYA